MPAPLNFDSFRIINPNMMSFSTAQIRITTTSLQFNIATLAELEYPERVCLLASDDGAQIAVMAHYPSAMEESTIPFYTKEMRSQHVTSLILKDKECVKRLRKARGWEDKAIRKVSGILYKKEGTLLFDLEKAVEAKLGAKGRVYSLSDYPSVEDIMEKLKPAPLALCAGINE